MDWRIQVAIAFGIVIVLAVLILRKTFTKGRFKAGKNGFSGTLEGNPNAAPPAQGVDLGGAEFKDANEFRVADEARVKAQQMKAGSKNIFAFGTAAINPKKKTDSGKEQSR